MNCFGNSYSETASCDNCRVKMSCYKLLLKNVRKHVKGGFNVQTKK
mgnify:CR=1 FL=1